MVDFVSVKCANFFSRKQRELVFFAVVINAWKQSRISSASNNTNYVMNLVIRYGTATNQLCKWASLFRNGPALHLHLPGHDAHYHGHLFTYID